MQIQMRVHGNCEGDAEPERTLWYHRILLREISNDALGMPYDTYSL